jgi:protein subunit release factor A
MANGESASNKNTERSDMVGSGMRGDKIRTYRFQEDTVINHNTDKKFNLKKVMRGNIDVFWD